MKKFTGILILTLILLFTGSNTFCQHKKVKQGKNAQTRVDFTLTMSDGTILDCTKFIPSGTPPSGGRPALILCHGYGGSKEDDMQDAEDYASDGIFSVCYSMRGQGNSGGLSNLMSTTEMNDFIAVVNYVKNQSNINVNKVGAMGGSQGGTIPLMAACYNPGLLRCIISDVSSPEFATSWMENNSIKMTLLWTLSYGTDIARYNNQVKAYRNWILTDTPDKFDSLRYYMPINRDFMNKVGQNTTPLLVSTVWQDKFFSTYGFIKAINSLASPYRMYFGTFYAHGAEYSDPEDEYHTEFISSWMDYYLMGENNGVTDSVKFVYAASKYPRQNYAWTWKRFSSAVWPPQGTENVKFYFHPYGRINNVPHTTTPDYVNFTNDIKDPSITMTEAVNYEFTGTQFEAKFGKTELVFETLPLTTETKMVGTPFVNIHYKPGTTIAQFNFQIYEIKSGTTPYLISRANFTERNVTPGVLRQLYFYGTSHSHVFQAGSKIRVVLTNLDNIDYDDFLRTNPYVLPSLKGGTHTIYMNNANQTYIQLPLIGYVPIGINPVSSEIPVSLELYQNYPNPFNPETKIKFDIPESASGKNIKVKVYNSEGKEVAVLVNESLKSGTYETKFDASNLSSGVYFYAIYAGGTLKKANRMMLVK
jgi:predicted acyl esterase